MGFTDDDVLGVLSETADAVTRALDRTDDWGLAGTRPGQHKSDLAADSAARGVLEPAGFGVLSEESGRSGSRFPVTVVIDPLDGSTNAARGVSWWATSLCAVDADGPRAALVVDLANGTRYEAVRGGGARVDGAAATPSGCIDIRRAIIGLNGLPARHLGWAQCRALGAAALDLCAVATGHLDAFTDCSADGLAPWDYLGALLVCREAGAVVRDLHDEPLVDLANPARRSVLAAATPALADALVSARRSTGPMPFGAS